jgi:hypothetical protein
MPGLPGQEDRGQAGDSLYERACELGLGQDEGGEGNCDNKAQEGARDGYET